jgi:hypothetical protein
MADQNKNDHFKASPDVFEGIQLRASIANGRQWLRRSQVGIRSCSIKPPVDGYLQAQVPNAAAFVGHSSLSGERHGE